MTDRLHRPQSADDTTDPRLPRPDGRRLASAALSVDLDRALLRTDPFHERLFIAVKTHPFAAVRLAAQRLKGMDSFRRSLLVETQDSFRLSACPREAEVERLVHSARQQGKPVEWRSREPAPSSAEDPDLRHLLENLGEAERTDDTAALAARLQARYPQGFAHVGSDAADLPLWRAASERYGVNLGAVVRRQAEREGLGIVEIAHRPSVWQALLRSMRPHQWLKNLLVFVPFALSLSQLGRIDAVHALLAFAALCLLTSGTYLINDLFDVEADRRHPRKRRRPIAAGDLPLPLAGGTSLAMIAVALVAGFLLRPAFGLALGAYLVMTLAYSFRLKRVAMVDVLIIAMLFTLRILAGMLMVSSAPSHWLLMFSIFFFLSLAFMKREVEFNVMHQAGRQVLSGRGYAMEDRMYVLSCGLSSGMASIVIFGLFVSETANLQQANYGAPILLWGIMFCLSYWILRMWLLTTRGLMNDDPILFAAKDRTSLVIGAVSAILAVAAQTLTF